MTNRSWLDAAVFLNNDFWNHFASLNEKKFWKLAQLLPGVLADLWLLSSLTLPASPCYPLSPQGRHENLTGAVETI